MLHRQLEGQPLKFGRPSPFPCLADTPVVVRDRQVGIVQAMWVEDDLVHWVGRLDPEPLPAVTDNPPSLNVSVPEPTLRDAIDGAWLVGVPAIAQARTERDGQCTVFVDWTVTRMELMRPIAAPWPGLTLNVR
ncbi:hypothetical protein [Streptomyces sp. NPDC047070]|uniref:hypothetical protein n=1 Tax=Streptomyces sp. NPDC047070 TaxID=3154923 RepID=UPI003456398E